uniref:Uncharacterized protein n=1 Tax=Aegilops tauschii subsp. strangulata TaxID=200361 RepID=A0A453H8H2_AEGTS
MKRLTLKLAYVGIYATMLPIFSMVALAPKCTFKEVVEEDFFFLYSYYSTSPFEAAMNPGFFFVYIISSFVIR